MERTKQKEMFIHVCFVCVIMIFRHTRSDSDEMKQAEKALNSKDYEGAMKIFEHFSPYYKKQSLEYLTNARNRIALIKVENVMKMYSTRSEPSKVVQTTIPFPIAQTTQTQRN